LYNVNIITRDNRFVKLFAYVTFTFYCVSGCRCKMIVEFMGSAGIVVREGEFSSWKR